ncbi:MAG: histidinol-phosphatase [Bacteroidales bacterium]|nr:histidinol-phosphatase [Bacteroidales bacterium]
MTINNYHTHSLYCDGKDLLPLYVQEAEQKHFTQLGFSSHAPLPFDNNFSIKMERIPEYTAEIESLQTSTHVTLLKSLECDFVPGISYPFTELKENHHLDYIIGGVHLVRPANNDELWFIDGPKREIYDEGLDKLFDHNIKRAVTTFWEQTFEMIETQPMDIIAHVDKIKMHNQHRFFQEDEQWYRVLADKALQLIKSHGIIMEVNTRGLYKKRCDSLYPSVEMLLKARKMDIPVVISSDAHQAKEIDLLFEEAYEVLRQCGYEQLMRFDVQKGYFVPQNPA